MSIVKRNDGYSAQQGDGTVREATFVVSQTVGADGATVVSETNPFPVEIIAVDPTSITLTGDVVVDTFGALDDAKVTNPDAASATIPALARGQLAELVAILAKLSDDPSTETTLATLATETTLGTIATEATLGTVATEVTLAGVALESGGNLDDILSNLQDLNTAIGVAADAAGASTIIGQLKQIAINTTVV